MLSVEGLKVSYGRIPFFTAWISEWAEGKHWVFSATMEWARQRC